jgi:hypothetical protein
MCTSESKINKKFTITTQDPTASHRISHLSFTRVPSSRLSIYYLVLMSVKHDKSGNNLNDIACRLYNFIADPRDGEREFFFLWH